MMTVELINEGLIASIPLKKMGEVRDVAKLVSYFCEEHSSFITGTEVIVDGGMTL